MRIHAWTLRDPAEPLELLERDEVPGAGEVLVEIAGCGVCHTDLGFLYDGVPTRHPLPLTLGHEISGSVVEAGPDAGEWSGADVVVPAVIPCGDCKACKVGRGSICPKQIFPGNDVHGGFATHVRVPSRGLCRVPDLTDRSVNPQGLDLATLSVIADAVSTPYQAIKRSKLIKGDIAVVVGAGGVGGFAVQIAAALGAHVVAIDTDPARLEPMRSHGAELTLDASELDFKAMRKAVKAFTKEHDVSSWDTRIFECSGSPQGQQTAFGLLGHGGYLSLVGFTPAKVEVRLSNLMAFDAVAEGNWGCLPEHYPAVLQLVLSGKVALPPFVQQRPLASINETLIELHQHGTPRRVILIPES
ncbi:MAG: 6-hydroxycyclohex-1-ene-1-carbonyl-CoA dehydrogenase [Planctomycetota bacterium]|jgi:6-hydroxycyclohex-1-ene-1-carbonyl-CoA dehydrogenase